MAVNSKAIIIAGVLALMAAGSRAEEFEDTTIVSEIVVKAVLPGPAWWRVSDADSTVHILVVPEAAPANLAWSTMILDARMKRARLLILPVEVTVSLTQIPGLVRTIKGDIIDKRPLEETLPEPLRSQFIGAREELGMKRGQFLKYKPAYAGDKIEREIRKRQGMARGKVTDALSAAARRDGVQRTKPTVGLRPERLTWDALEAEAAMARERTCLGQTLATAKPIISAERQAALDWAQGDVRGLLALPKLRRRTACDHDLLSRLDRTHRPELLRAQIVAIENALKTPGETIAVVRPGLLLSEDGVLMTLKAQGYAIRTPANITEP